MVHNGTIVDASLIAAPKPTKNHNSNRDPEIHQTKKGDQRHFRMTVHASINARSGYVYTIIGTFANEQNVSKFSKQLLKNDHVTDGDSEYLGSPIRPEIKDDVLS